MSNEKLPFMKFFTGDWMKDPGVRSASLEARGLWMDMLCLMWEAHRRGYLCHRTGLPVTVEQLGRMVGSTADRAEHLVQELLNCGVCSRSEDGVLYSRRMERDEQRRKTNENNGKKGGNPLLVGKSDKPLVNHVDKRQVNRTSNPHISDVRDQNSEGNSNTPKPPRGVNPDFETFYAAYPRKIGREAAAKAYERVQQRLQAQRIQERGEVAAFLLERATAYARSPAGTAGQFTPHPSTWLNEGRYADDDSEWQRTSSSGKNSGPNTGSSVIAPGDGERW